MRLRNAVSGVTVSVDKETAALLGSDWADAAKGQPQAVQSGAPSATATKGK